MSDLTPLPQQSSPTSSEVRSKTCTGCKLEKELGEFSPRVGGVHGRASRCHECRRLDRARRAPDFEAERRRRWKEDPEYRERNRQATKRYREKNRDALSERARVRYRKMREQLIVIYGGSCECCGEETHEFLAVDHVNGGGSNHRKVENPTDLFRRLVKKGVRDMEYRLLCHNCNHAIAHYGSCPHGNLPS